MDVRALILVGGPVETADAPAELNVVSAAPAEKIGQVPIALLDVLGRPVVHHVARQLHEAGVHSVAVVSDDDPAAAAYVRHAQRDDLRWTQAGGAEYWRAALNSFTDLAQGGAEIVLVFRLGPYTEMNFDELIQFHLDQHARVTCAAAPDGTGVGVFAISASRRNDAAYLFRHQLRECRATAAEYAFDGYMNRLRDGRDLRQLAVDALYGSLRVRPAGRQVKPGVWVEDGARVHPKARVLAPAFIGARARLRAGSVITRGTTVEHHGEIDCGSVIENSTILPYSYVGPGLDVSHSVVGFRRLAHLRREVEVEIGDPKLIAMITANAPLRALSSAAGLAGFLPMQLFRGLFAKSHRQQPTELPAAVEAPAAALQNPAADEAQHETEKFPGDLVVARRYGNE